MVLDELGRERLGARVLHMGRVGLLGRQIDVRLQVSREA